ncbi:hypothetical protein B0T19DRAFT_293589 [Cercophora scortea]|uniref:Nephrocystin 3-like N-terminal domain-containing protein n=1 Tax=Cercophora scortea TaxID=314031 RepID=A0AAE0M3P9_9PEZI|nr:hypothetical protein B0T19DRAFT_293589 [Cercophora scortea]
MAVISAMTEFRRTTAEQALHSTLDWLSASSFQQDYGPPVTPAPGTTTWLPSHPTFLKWIQNDESKRILWIQGSPGCGKSVMAASFANQLEEQLGATVISCRFPSCSRGEQGPTARLVATSIISHLLRHRDVLVSEDVKSILNRLTSLAGGHKSGGPGTCPLNPLWEIAVQTLALVKPEVKVFLIIDGFDGCHFNNDAPMTAVAKKLERLAAESRIGIAVFSRPRPGSSRFAIPCLQLQLTAQLLAADIEIFSASLFETLDINPELRDRVLDKIRSGANGSFLWAEMLLRHMALPCKDEELLLRLDSCPPGITQFYDMVLRDTAMASANDAMSRHDFTVKRRQLFCLICEAREPLSIAEVARALGYGSWKPEVVLALSKPLVDTTAEDGRIRFIHPSVREFLTDEARRPFMKEDDTVLLSTNQCHNDLAKSSLESLLDTEYASPKLIGQYLHQNFGVTLDNSETPCVPDPSKGVSFEYAAKHWDFHLTSIQNPTIELLELAVEFLRGFQFVFWSEWSFKDLRRSIARASTVWSKLKSWVPELPEDKQCLINLGDYFTYPYNALTKFYWESRDDDQELPWLAQMRLGRFYVDVAKTDEANRIRKEVRDGLIELLGSRNPLTLQARTDFALSLTVGGWYLDALAELREIVEIERDVLGKRSPELYRTEMAMGEVELYLNKFAESAATQKRAVIGFMGLFGVDSKPYLSAELWYCYPLIETNQLSQALDILQLIWNKRREEYGAGDLFAASVQYSIGVIQHKQGREVESIKNLQEAFHVRNQLVPLTSFWAMDFAIELLIAYRDFGHKSEAAALLKELDEKADVGRYFNRHCQVTHVRALLLWDRGKWNEAITLLQGLLISANRDQYNRPVFWITLDLALMLRKRGNKDDARQAESLFDGILVDLEAQQHLSPAQLDTESGHNGDDDGDEPSSPRLLKLAETALTLTRNQMFEEVDKLFEEEKVAWYREEDLWLWAGGPAADTASLKPPVGTLAIKP